MNREVKGACVEYYVTIRCTTLHYTSLDHTTQHNTTQHNTTQEYTTLQCTPQYNIPSKVSIHELAIAYRFPNHSSDKLEVIQMIHVYHAQWVRLESCTVSRSRKQGVVAIKYFTG